MMSYITFFIMLASSKCNDAELEFVLIPKCNEFFTFFVRHKPIFSISLIQMRRGTNTILFF